MSLEMLSFQVLGSPVGLLLSHGQAVVGGSALPLTLCRGVCSAGAESSSKAVFAWDGCSPASLKAQKPALVPALPGQASPCSGLLCTCSAPSLPQQLCAGNKCVGNAAEQLLLRFPPAPLGLSHYFSSYFSGIFFFIKTASCTWL